MRPGRRHPLPCPGPAGGGWTYRPGEPPGQPQGLSGPSHGGGQGQGRGCPKRFPGRGGYPLPGVQRQGAGGPGGGPSPAADQPGGLRGTGALT
ncbi:hypothetical protein NE684_15685 [Pseudoflavonifractor phocaeensis]|nr:hypothetical protein [Pseudoflavonifractor phocaeensis]